MATIFGSVDAAVLPDGWLDDRLDSAIKGAIESALRKRDFVNMFGSKVVLWFLGNDYQVYDVKTRGDNMIIEYIDPENIPDDNDDEIGSVGSVLRDERLGPQQITTAGKLSKIKHIVVLMMENRSFDQVLGYLSLESDTDNDGPRLPNTTVNGLKRDQFDEWANDYNGEKYPPYLLTNPHILQSPNHNYDSVRDQKQNGLKGFVTDFAAIPNNPEEPKVVMGYYDDNLLEVYAQLADEYLVCDRWYCAIPSGTWPNRFITTTGQLDTKPDGSPDFNNPSLSKFYPISTPSIFDHLTTRGVTWKYYEHGYCFLRLFTKYTYDMENVIDAKDPDRGFFKTAREGNLPSVTFLDPDFIEYPPGNDDHAPSHPYAGQKLIGEVVNALKSNEEAWQETMLIITYDEHGGFWDHVNPGVDEPAPMVSGIMDEYGIPSTDFYCFSLGEKRGRKQRVI